MLSLPKVSIITPVHSESLMMIEKNFQSVYMQKTDYEYEHIVICDNPNRDYGLLTELGEKYEVKLLFPKKNLGLPGARNFGIDNSDGNFIMLLDADDRFVAGRIQKQIEFMLEHDLSHCYGGYKEWHWGEDSFNTKVGAIIPPEENNLEYLKNLNNVCYCGSNCFKREVYENIGGFDERLNGLGAEDLEYWLRIALMGYKSKCLPKVLYYLGITSSNMTAKYLAGGQFERAYAYIKEKHSL
jgi:glycosyltransferase involved in cell wall biosynthesis